MSGRRSQRSQVALERARLVSDLLANIGEIGLIPGLKAAAHLSRQVIEIAIVRQLDRSCVVRCSHLCLVLGCANEPRGCYHRRRTHWRADNGNGWSECRKGRGRYRLQFQSKLSSVWTVRICLALTYLLLYLLWGHQKFGKNTRNYETPINVKIIPAYSESSALSKRNGGLQRYDQSCLHAIPGTRKLKSRRFLFYPGV